LLLIFTGAFAAPQVFASPYAEAFWSKALNKEIAGLERQFKGRISIYVSDPELGVEFGYDAERPSYIASGVKVPFMIEVFRQIDQGLLSLDDKLVYRQKDLRDGSPRLKRRPLGSRITIRELVHLMVQNSDNAASDLLASHLGLDNINRGLRAQGFKMDNPLVGLLDVRRAVFRELDPRADDLSNLEIRAVRWTWGWQSHVRKLEDVLGRPRGTYSPDQLHAAYRRFYETGVNHVRVSTLGKIMEAMASGTLVSVEASAAMLKIMRNSKTSRHRMMGNLPRNTPVAHKTGSQWERICDYGVITLPNKKPLIFAGCLADGNDRKRAERSLAKIARRAYDLALAEHRRLARTKM
jgi:beta-lactamase class A